jgi:hypothetical protein
MVQSMVSHCRLGSTETFTSNVEFRQFIIKQYNKITTRLYFLQVYVM